MKVMKIDFSKEGEGIDQGLEVASELFGILTMMDEEAQRLYETDDGDVVKVDDTTITLISESSSRFESFRDFIKDQEYLQIEERV